MLTSLSLIYAAVLLRAPNLRFRGPVALLATVALVDLWSHLGLSFPSLGQLEALPFTLVCACVASELRGFGKRRDARTLVSLTVIMLALGALVYWMLGRSALLPGHDPVAVPTFARLLRAHGGIPPTEAPIDGRAWYYPPGFAVILTFVNWLPPLAVLWIFKIIDIAAIALTPLAWVLAARRIAMQRLELAAGAAALVFGFVVFDRTLYLAPGLAGKNSQLLAAAIIPIVFEVILAARRSWKLAPVVVLITAGAVLVHFSAIYMLAALLTLWFFARGVSRPADLMRIGVAFTLGVAMTTPRLFAAVQEHPDARPMVSPYAGRASAFMDALFGEQSPALFIFSELGIAWPFKGVVLLILGAMAAVGFMATYRSRARTARAARACVLAVVTVVGLLAVFAGLVPLPVSPDFARWFIYDFVALAAGLFFVVATRVAEMTRARSWLPRTLIAAVPVALVVQVALSLHAPDTTEIDVGVTARIARREYASNREVERLFDQLQRWNPRSCALVSHGTPAAGGRVIQDYKPFEYVPAFSNCYFANGSWLSLSSGIDPTCDGQATQHCGVQALKAHPQDDVFIVDEQPSNDALSITLGPYYLRRACLSCANE